jgi:hypothetical protein
MCLLTAGLTEVLDGYIGGVVSLLLTLLGLVFAPIGQIAVQTGKLPTHEKAGGEGNVPSDFQSLSGCSNPNTGVANQDWGVGSNPVYVDPKSLTVGTPAYATNVVFWISRETKPGQSVLLTGAFTHATKRVRLAFIPPGSQDWQSILYSPILPPGSRLALWPMDFAGASRADVRRYRSSLRASTQWQFHDHLVQENAGYELISLPAFPPPA